MGRSKKVEKDPNPERNIRIADNPNYRRYKDTEYYVGRLGDVWHVYERFDRKIKPYFKKNDRCIMYAVTYTTDRAAENPRGRRTHKSVKSFVWETYKGKIPDGYIVYNKNGLKTDNALTNLAIMKCDEYGKKYGPRTSRTRYVLDTQTGKVYLGLRSAGEATGYSRQGVFEIVKGESSKVGRFKYLNKRPYEKDE